MTRQEIDEALFKRVRKKFRKWSPSKCSGYVHGVRDGLDATTPKPDREYVQDVLTHGGLEARDYSVGYFYGFVDAYGIDVCHTSWYRDSLKVMMSRTVDYRWWMQDD